MGLAPVPQPIDAQTGPRQFLRIRVKDRTYEFVPELALEEKFVIRAATGLPFEAFLPAQQEREFGEDSAFVLWWLARRQSGEPALPYKQALAEWPADMVEGDLEFVQVDLDAEDGEPSPEGSGPAS